MERVWPWNSGQTLYNVSVHYYFLLSVYNQRYHTILKSTSCSKYVELLISNWITILICTIQKRKKWKNVFKQRLLPGLKVWHLTWLHRPLSWEEVQKSILWKPRAVECAGEREAQIPSCFISHSQFSSVIVDMQWERQNYSADDPTGGEKGIGGVSYQ